MNRRKLLKSGVSMVFLSAALPAFSLDGAEPFSDQLFEQALASGEPFLLDFTATW